MYIHFSIREKYNQNRKYYGKLLWKTPTLCKMVSLTKNPSDKLGLNKGYNMSKLLDTINNPSNLLEEEKRLFETIQNINLQLENIRKQKESMPEINNETVTKNPKLEFTRALCKAQLKFKPVQKTSKNPYFKSQYAPYEEVWESVGRPLNENNIAVVHKTGFINGSFCLVTKLMHIEGYEEESVHTLNSTEKMQEKGSAETYAKRYNLVALTAVPVVNEDDDGEEDRKLCEETISEIQAKQIEDLIETSKVNKEGFLKWLKIDEVKKITKDKYDVCIKELKKQKVL